MTKSPYHQIKPLQHPVQAECWNFTSGEIFTLPAGTMIELEHGYDATHTSCMVTGDAGDHPGMLLPCNDGNVRRGYRFIIENQALGLATKLDIPKRTYDMVGEIIQLETTGLPIRRTRKLLKALKGNRLQGSYGRLATQLGV